MVWRKGDNKGGKNYSSYHGPWNKGLNGEEYRKHYEKGVGGIFKKGHATWNKGKSGIYMKETLKLMSEKRMGKNPWNKNKEFKKIQGYRHWNWKGGISSQNKRLRLSIKGKLWRLAIFERDKWMCQNINCGYCKNKKGTKLNAHHIKPWAIFPELRFDINNGITYCEKFHIRSKMHKGIVKEVILCR